MKLILTLLFLVLASCGSDTEKAGEPWSKEEARERGNVDGRDLCDEFNWYGDGECDTFCSTPDPDCGRVINNVNNINNINNINNVNNENNIPDMCPSDDEVWYFPGSQDDPSICFEDLFGCMGEMFYSQDCGCGCLINDFCDDFLSQPNVEFVAPPEECAVIDFGCPPDSEYFENQCGCGCILPEPPPVCEFPPGADVSYVAESREECAAIDFDCFAPEWEHFENDCGCGCVRYNNPTSFQCDHPLIEYVSRDPDQCAVIGQWLCVDGQQFSNTQCGCGCIRDADFCMDSSFCDEGEYCGEPVRFCGDNCDPSFAPVCVPLNCDDGTQVLCNALPPICPVDTVLSVRMNCWACVPIDDCR